MVINIIVYFDDFRVYQTFLLHHDSGWSREHCGHSVSEHTPRPQWRHPHLPYQVHHVGTHTHTHPLTWVFDYYCDCHWAVI